MRLPVSCFFASTAHQTGLLFAFGGRRSAVSAETDSGIEVKRDAQE
jgi:hypothetical protein